jgi:hypothetical protein
LKLSVQGFGAGRTRAGAHETITMPEHVASRTLVKSAPELWAECSDPASLARHLGAFGEIRITKLEPETAVAWEGEDVRGTVTLEPAGWGTRVILTALEEGSAAADAAVAVPSPEIEEPAAAEDEPRAPVVETEPPVFEEETPVFEEEPPVFEADTPVAEEEAPVAEVQPPVFEEEPPAVPDSPPASRPGFFARLFGRRRGAEKPRVDGHSDPVPPGPEAADDPPAATLPTRRRQVSAVAQPGAEAAPAPELEAAPAPEPEAAPAPELETQSVAQPPPPDPEPPAPPAPQASALVEALDSLGRAHHRPYSRG